MKIISEIYHKKKLFTYLFFRNYTHYTVFCTSFLNICNENNLQAFYNKVEKNVLRTWNGQAMLKLVLCNLTFPFLTLLCRSWMRRFKRHYHEIFKLRIWTMFIWIKKGCIKKKLYHRTFTQLPRLYSVISNV